MKLFFQIMAGIGLFLLAAAGLTYLQSANFINHAQVAIGSIVDISISSDPDNNTDSYCPEITYTTEAGQVVSFEANVCSSAGTYEVGDQLELYYDPQDPQGAQLKSFAAQYLACMSLVVTGLPIAVAGLLGLFLQKKPSKSGSL